MTTKKRGRPKKVAEVDLCSWSILVPWETRIAVKKAAERSQTGVNAWIDQVLIKEAKAVLTGKNEIAKPEDVRDVFTEEVLKKIQHSTDVLQELVKKINDTDKAVAELNKPSWIKKLIGK